MNRFMKRLWKEEVIRYLFFGVLTTGVNFSVFLILRYGTRIGVNTANLCSITAAVIFAFVVNRQFVFGGIREGFDEVIEEFVSFTGMRMGTLAVEFFGVWILSGYIGFSDVFSKLAVQCIVIIVNYIISKFVVFKKRQIGGVANE